MIKILIADDHAIVRAGLRQILADTTDMIVAGEATNGLEVLEQVRKDHWDLVLLDLAMPGKGGLETLKELKKERPKLPVLVLSIYPEKQYAVRSLKAGASGYLTKESAPEELIAAIGKVAQGGKYFSSSFAQNLVNHLEEDAEKLVHEMLSDREYQVMLLIASGKTASKIADEMCLSIKTVSTYRSRALTKMGMKNNSVFTNYAIRNGLIY